MARGRRARWSGPLEGLVVTRYGHGVPCTRIRVVEAAHPLPDAAGREATARILELVRGLDPGRSRSSASVRRRLGAARAAARTSRWMTPGGDRALLRSGAAITRDQLRAQAPVARQGRSPGRRRPPRPRRHLRHLGRARRRPIDHRLRSDGAGLRRPSPRRSPSWTGTASMSPGGPMHLGRRRSGPTAGSPRATAPTRRPSRATRRSPATRSSVLATARPPSTPLPGWRVPRASRRSSWATNSRARLVSSAGEHAACLALAAGGERPWPRSDAVAAAPPVRRAPAPPPAPFVLLSGGETTVTVAGRGRGGRNTEYLLGLALGPHGCAGRQRDRRGHRRHRRQRGQRRRGPHARDARAR